MAKIETIITITDTEEFENLVIENEQLKIKNKNLTETLKICEEFINKVSNAFADAHIKMKEINQLNQDNL